MDKQAEVLHLYLEEQNKQPKECQLFIVSINLITNLTKIFTN